MSVRCTTRGLYTSGVRSTDEDNTKTPSTYSDFLSGPVSLRLGEREPPSAPKATTGGDCGTSCKDKDGVRRRNLDGDWSGPHPNRPLVWDHRKTTSETLARRDPRATGVHLGRDTLRRTPDALRHSPSGVERPQTVSEGRPELT